MPMPHNLHIIDRAALIEEARVKTLYGDGRIAAIITIIMKQPSWDEKFKPVHMLFGPKQLIPALVTRTERLSALVLHLFSKNTDQDLANFYKICKMTGLFRHDELAIAPIRVTGFS